MCTMNIVQTAGTSNVTAVFYWQKYDQSSEHTEHTVLVPLESETFFNMPYISEQFYMQKKGKSTILVRENHHSDVNTHSPL